MQAIKSRPPIDSLKSLRRLAAQKRSFAYCPSIFSREEFTMSSSKLITSALIEHVCPSLLLLSRAHQSQVVTAVFVESAMQATQNYRDLLVQEMMLKVAHVHMIHKLSPLGKKKSLKECCRPGIHQSLTAMTQRFRRQVPSAGPSGS